MRTDKYFAETHEDSGKRLMWAGRTRCIRPNPVGIIYEEATGKCSLVKDRAFKNLMNEYYTAVHIPFNADAAIE